MTRPLPDRIWIGRKEAVTKGDYVLYPPQECILDNESDAAFARDHLGWEVTEYVSRARMNGLIHAASTIGKTP